MHKWLMILAKTGMSVYPLMVKKKLSSGSLKLLTIT